ncbi:MAG: imidazolonepropionase-like amidohydrolase [Luteibaculaceae bacterium]|jgi:imidazolonepropionase-like amidohydrolase
MKNLLFILPLIISGTAFGQRTPAATNTDKVCITGGTFHLGNGTSLEEGVLVIQDGKIASLGTETDLSDCDRRIEAQGKHIYPGFIAPNSTLGIAEIGAVRASQDQRETGSFNPHVRSIIAYNPESRVTETVRSNGVLIAQITPRGGWISGSSTVVQLDAWNWEDAVIALDEGLHLNWPSKYKQSGWWAEPGPIEVSKKYGEQKEALTTMLQNAKTYKGKGSDLRMEAMQWIFKGSQTLYIHCNAAKEIRDALILKNELGIEKMVIVGGYEADLVSDALVESQVAVLLRRVHDLPIHKDGNIHKPFELPAKLSALGVEFAFQNAGDMEQMQTRNLPSYGGTAVAFGLDYELAVKALTYTPAKILGIQEKYGSLEIGKSATLFISNGDALDMLTNSLEHAFIDGRHIDIGNRQKDLYEKFSKKYAE